jgi:hypothetical protein
MLLPRPLLLVLVLLNAVVLLGQLWPEGAPPFARTVNIVFLCASLAVFLTLLLRRPRRVP